MLWRAVERRVGFETAWFICLFVVVDYNSTKLETREAAQHSALGRRYFFCRAECRVQEQSNACVT